MADQQGPWLQYQGRQIPAPPPGFTVDTPQATPKWQQAPIVANAAPAQGALPPLPPGFKLDKPAQGPWTKYGHWQDAPIVSPQPSLARRAGAALAAPVEAGASLATGALAPAAAALQNLFTRKTSPADYSRAKAQWQYTPKNPQARQDIAAVTAIPSAILGPPVKWLADHVEKITHGKMSSEEARDAINTALMAVGGKEAATGRASAALTRAPEVARAVTQSQRDGFVLPVSQTQPGIISNIAESVAGKIHTQQGLSRVNTTAGNALVRKGLGLAPDAPLDVDQMAAIRKAAGADYAAVQGVAKPDIVPTVTAPGFHGKLDDIADSRKGSIRTTPADDPIVVAANELKAAPKFTTTQAVTEISRLRDQADSAFAAGNKKLGVDFKRLASAVEGAIDQHLVAVGAPKGLLAKFRAARTRIAQSYDVEQSLDGAGNVDLAKLGSRKSGMTGDLATAARFGKRFGRKYGQPPGKTGSVLPMSLLGAAATEAGTAMLTGHTLAALPGAAAGAALGGRMALQGLTESRLGQRAIGAVQRGIRKSTRVATRTAAGLALANQGQQ